MSTSETMAAGSRGSRGSRVGRARWTPGQLWQVPTFVVGLAAFITVAAATPIRHPTASRQFDATVAALRQGLQKNQDPTSLMPLAENALAEVHGYGDRAAEVQFLAGSVYSRLAAVSPPETARDYWRRAAELFEMAQQLGADERDVPMLEYRLGWALYAQDRDVPRALDLMTRNVDRGADQPLDGYRLLVQANLKLAVPDLAAALAASRKVVELTDDRDADALAQARFDHANLLLRMERRADAVKELERIGTKASRPLRAKARMLAVTTCEHEGMWSKALVFWQDLLRDGAQVPGGKGRVLYSIGACSLQLELPDYPGAAKAWQEAVKQGGPEGQAAGLRLGALRLAGPTVDPTQGLEDWRQALAAVQTPADYRNQYLKIEEVREFFDQALAQFQEAQDYERMRTVAELYRKVGPAGYADDKIAQAAEAQAKELQNNSETPTDQVRVCYRMAAEAYAQAAHARPGKDGFDALWRSAQCYLQARDADRASKVLVELEKLDQADVRLAEGWYRLAELERTLNHREDARSAYIRSMQYAATPFAARARFQLAMEQVERKNWDKAVEILQPNLEIATQDREAHEQSFYEMARILVKKHDDARAAIYLNQATARYPNNPNALLMRDALAECYHRLAAEAGEKEKEEMKAFQGPLTDGQKAELESNLRNYKTARRTRLGEALAVYQAIADELGERERKRTLTPLEAQLRRRAVLGMGECSHELDDYANAVRLYQGLIEHNRAKVESLIACARIVRIMELAPKLELLSGDAQREVIAAARVALPLIQKDLATMDPKGPDFQGENVWSWRSWQHWIAGAVVMLAERCRDPHELLESLHRYRELHEHNRTKFEGLIACECIVRLKDLALKTGILGPDLQAEFIAATRTALTLAQRDLTAMDPKVPEFHGEGVMSWQHWQHWIATEQQRIGGPAPAVNKGPGI